MRPAFLAPLLAVALAAPVVAEGGEGWLGVAVPRVPPATVRVRPSRMVTPGPFRTLAFEGGQVTGLDFSPDGRHLAASYIRGGMRLWDVDLGEALDALGDPDHRYYRFPTDEFMTAATWGPDGRHVFAGTHSGRLRIWDLREGRELPHAQHRPGTNLVVGVQVSADGEVLTWNDNTRRIWLWRWREQGSPQAVRTGERIRSATSFHPDGSKLAVAAESGEVLLVDTATGAVTGRLPGTGHFPTSLEFSPDGRRLLVATSRGQVSVQEAVGGSYLWQTKVREGGHACFSPGGTLVAYVRKGREVVVVRAATGAPVPGWDLELANRTGNQVRALAWSPDGATLAIGDIQSRIQLFHRPEGEVAPPAR